MDGVNDALFNAAPNVQQAIAQIVTVTPDYTDWAKSKSIEQKYTQIYYTETKLMFDVAYTLANIQGGPKK